MQNAAAAVQAPRIAVADDGDDGDDGGGGAEDGGGADGAAAGAAADAAADASADADAAAVDDALASLSLSAPGRYAGAPRKVLLHLHRLEVFLVDTPARLDALAASGDLLRAPALGVDLEGVDLGAPDGAVCIVQLALGRRGPVILVDVHALTPAVAFPPAPARASPAGVLAAAAGAAPVKVLFDVRADAAALARHGVELRGAGAVEDAQLLVVALMFARGRPADRLVGLGSVLERCRLARLSNAERAAAAKARARARALFVPEAGGSYDAWRARPLAPALLEYATDARYLLDVRESVRAWKGGRFDAVLGPAVAAATARRLDAARAAPAAERLTRDAATLVEPRFAEDVELALAEWRAANPGR